LSHPFTVVYNPYMFSFLAWSLLATKLLLVNLSVLFLKVSSSFASSPVENFLTVPLNWSLLFVLMFAFYFAAELAFD